MLCTMYNVNQAIVQEENDFGLFSECLQFIDSDIQTIQSLTHGKIRCTSNVSFTTAYRTMLTRPEYYQMRRDVKLYPLRQIYPCLVTSSLSAGKNSIKMVNDSIFACLIYDFCV